MFESFKWDRYVPFAAVVPTFAAYEAAAAARPCHAVGAAVAIAAVPVAISFGPVLPVVAALALEHLDELCRLCWGAEDSLKKTEK